MNDVIIRCGLILTPKDWNNITAIKNGYIAIEDGSISYIGDEYKPAEREIHLENSIVIPGLIDTHTHLPQFPIMGLGRTSLLDWLNEYVFPTESKFANKYYAYKWSDAFFRALKANGTTTAVVYLPPYMEACDIAFELANKNNFRVFMGNTLMNINVPDDLKLSFDTIIATSRVLIEKWHGKANGLINYILTPRFAISCDESLLETTSSLANEFGLMIQTHLFENINEIQLVYDMYQKDYLDVYLDAGFSKGNTIFAHCIYLPEDRAEGMKIVHCPTSNRYLQSGVMPYRKFTTAEAYIGLGSDISAGYNISMLDEAREAIETSKSYNIMQNSNERVIDPMEAIYLATLGGAKILGIDNITGSIEVGKSADMVIFDIGQDINKDISVILSKLLYTRNYELKVRILHGNVEFL